jgi:hypothetical protein
MSADYSGTPLPKKLGIKAGSRVLLINAPSNFRDELISLPDGVTFITDETSSVDVIMLFVDHEIELLDRFTSLAKRLVPAGGLWVAYPKKAAKVPTDLNDNKVRDIGLERGLVDNKVCAIDAVWTGLRFVIRVKDRA